MLAFSPRGVEETVIGRIVEVVEIEHRTEFHLLELADEQQGEGARLGGQRHGDRAERVAGRRQIAAVRAAARGISVDRPAASAGA